MNRVILDCYMGSDEEVIKKARVDAPELAKDYSESTLISYLLKHHHNSCFEHCVLTWYIEAPIFVARQWMRHRIGSYNERSGRKVNSTQLGAYTLDRFNTPSTKSKQGSSSSILTLSQIEEAKQIHQEAIDFSFNSYNKLLEIGLAPELARTILPLGTYTAFYWTVNLSSFLNFIAQRDSPLAQEEIRWFAQEMKKIVTPLFPKTMLGFATYQSKIYI